MSIQRTTPARPEQLELQVEAIDQVVVTLIPEGTMSALALRAVATAAIRAYIDTLPYGNVPPRFKTGERVELVASQNGPPRSGTVVEIDLEPVVQAHLRVRFDDGEERQINPDVMRRIR